MNRHTHIHIPLLIVAAVLASCSSDRPSQTSTTPPERFVVGPSGGMFTNTDGVRLDVPSGALTSTITITIKKTTLPAGNAITPVSSVYEILPKGTTFAVPVTIRLPYIGGADRVLSFYYSLRDDDQILGPIGGASIANGVGEAAVSHFSIACIAFPSDTTTRDGGVAADRDGGPNPERDGGPNPTRDGGPTPNRDGGPMGCGCAGQPECEACCEIQEICGYTECVNECVP